MDHRLPPPSSLAMDISMTERRIQHRARQGVITLLLAGLASCVSPPPQPTPRPAPPPPTPAPALPAAPPQQDWRDVPLTPGRWSWHGAPGQASLAQYGAAGQAAVFALRCDLGTHNVVFSRAGSLAAPTAPILFTTSFGTFTLTAGNGGGQPPAMVAQTVARDPHLDQIAFSGGRFLVDVAGQTQLVLPSWPEVARVIEDCR
jgi:hypothetical protein